jgi:hypothetical protein
MTMKNIANPFRLRNGIAHALCLSFLIYLPLRVSSAEAAAHVAADLKSESQFRSEASRYDGAIRAISGIATMTLGTGDDLKKAFAILDRERPNLKFHRSKLVVLGLNDSTYTSALKKKVPDKRAAEAFAKEVAADRKALLKLEGAESLVTRMRRSVEADAATLRRIADRLKEAAEKIKKAGQGRTSPSEGAADGFKLVRAGFSEAAQPTAAPDLLLMSSQGGPAELLLVVLLAYAVLLVVTLYGVAIASFFNIGTKEDEDAVASCQVKADDGYLRCVSAASDLPSGFPFFQREAATALCYADWLRNQSGCLLEYL